MRYDDEINSYSRRYQPYNRSRQENWGANFGDQARPYGEDYGEDYGDDYDEQSRSRERSTQSRRDESIGFSYASREGGVHGDRRRNELDRQSRRDRSESYYGDARRISLEDEENFRGYTSENYPGYREMYRRGDYPETYRSAMSGYISEHVGHDRGRRDYFHTGSEGNLYGSQFGLYKGKGPRNYKRSDERIREEIIDRLTDDPWVDAVEIETDVKNREVILTGTVNDKSGKRRAEDIAESVSGVANVENKLRLRSATSQQRW